MAMGRLHTTGLCRNCPAMYLAKFKYFSEPRCPQYYEDVLNKNVLSQMQKLQFLIWFLPGSGDDIRLGQMRRGVGKCCYGACWYYVVDVKLHCNNIKVNYKKVSVSCCLAP